MKPARLHCIGLPRTDGREFSPEAGCTREELEAVLAESDRINAPAKPDMNSAQIFESHLRRLAASDPKAVDAWRARFKTDWTGTLAAIRKLHGVRA